MPDRSPSSLQWSSTSTLLFTASSEARSNIYSVSVPKHRSNKALATPPTLLYSNHSSSAVHYLPSTSSLVFTRSSLTAPPETFLLSLPSSSSTFQSIAQQLTHFSTPSVEGLDLPAGQSFIFPGAAGVSIQGWIIRPPGFKAGEKKKWPLAFLIHGGPQGAWEDSWSTRWNPSVFAQQGYVVVTINRWSSLQQSRGREGS